MKVLSLVVLLIFLVNGVDSVCKCAKLSKSKLKSTKEVSSINEPRDNVTSKACNPTACIYTLTAITKKGDPIIGGVIYNLKNFQKTNATLKFYNGKKAVGKYFFKISGKTNDTDKIVIPSSTGKYITISYSIDSKITKKFPTFIYYANLVKEKIISTTVSPTDNKLIKIEANEDEEGSILNGEELHGNVALILDMGSQNISKLLEIGSEIIKEITLDQSFYIEYYHFYLVLYKNGQVFRVNGLNTKEDLTSIVANMTENVDLKPDYQKINSLGVFLFDAFDKSKESENYQKVAIFVTDNNKFQPNYAKPIPSKPVNFFDMGDIHPVFINFNKDQTAQECYALRNILFSGTISNLVILHDYVTSSYLFESILTNGNRLCNLDQLFNDTSASNQSNFTFPVNDRKSNDCIYHKRYCNNMLFNIYCDKVNTALPIALQINFFDIETNIDTISIYNDAQDLITSISGHQVSNLKMDIFNSAYVKISFETDFKFVFYGGSLAFENCILRS
uniref:VWFA domain-containing protein n=1 Tax=Rhabditophanes sp. KR3021 TaxID=114890 RepID=A0AC35U375_9BILA